MGVLAAADWLQFSTFPASQKLATKILQQHFQKICSNI